MTEKDYFEEYPNASYQDYLNNKSLNDVMQNLDKFKERKITWWELRIFKVYVSMTNKYQEFLWDHYDTKDAARIAEVWTDLQTLRPFKNKYLNKFLQGIVLRIKLFF